MCDPTGRPGAACSPEWREEQVVPWAKTAQPDQADELELLVPGRALGSTMAYPPRRPGQWTGNRRIAQKRFVDGEIAWLDELVIPYDDPAHPGNRSNLLDVGAMISFLGADARARGTRVVVHVASDGRFIAGPFDAERDVPDVQQVWSWLEENRATFDLSSVDEITWCGIGTWDLDSKRGERDWTVRKHTALIEFWRALIAKSGGPAPVFEQRACANEPAGRAAPLVVAPAAAEVVGQESPRPERREGAVE
jgi:hypothetical protein